MCFHVTFRACGLLPFCSLRWTPAYLRSVEARQQPLVRGAAVVYLSDLSQAVEVGAHGEVVGPAEARDHDLVVQVTLFVHRHPGVARSTAPHRWRHKVAGQRGRQLWRKEDVKIKRERIQDTIYINCTIYKAIPCVFECVP